LAILLANIGESVLNLANIGNIISEYWRIRVRFSKKSGVNAYIIIGRIRRRLQPNPRVCIIIRTIMIDIDRWFLPWWCAWGCGVASSYGFGRHHDRSSFAVLLSWLRQL